MQENGVQIPAQHQVKRLALDCCVSETGKYCAELLRGFIRIDKHTLILQTGRSSWLYCTVSTFFVQLRRFGFCCALCECGLGNFSILCLAVHVLCLHTQKQEPSDVH